jgi:hypothetical protein
MCLTVALINGFSLLTVRTTVTLSDLSELCNVGLTQSHRMLLNKDDMDMYVKVHIYQYESVVESLQSHSSLTMSHWSSGLTLCFPSQGTWVQIYRGGIKWYRDSPVSNVLLHWWPRRDWSSLWPRLRRASSRTVTRPSYWQCDNPTWSHTAFLSRFTLAAGLPSGFTTDGGGCWGEPCGEPAISLHSYHVSLVQWTNPLLPVTSETRILMLAMARYTVNIKYVYG